MNKKKKILLILPVPIVCIILIIAASYYYYFYPKTEVTPITENITINNWDLASKFIPSDFNLSFKEISVESNTVFTEDELTKLAIKSLQEIPEIQGIVTGLKVNIENNRINIYTHIKYKKIPVEIKLSFSGRAMDGKGVFHYEGGKVGLAKIPKDTIFKNLNDTSIIQYNKENGDAILSFDSIKLIDIKDVKVENDAVTLVFKATLKFWDWLSK